MIRAFLQSCRGRQFTCRKTSCDSHVGLLSSVKTSALRQPRTASTAESRSVAIARLSTNASAPACIAARRTLSSSWTLRTITLSPGQLLSKHLQPVQVAFRSQGQVHDRHIGLKAAGSLDQRRLIGHHHHRFERRREQPAHAFGEAVVTVRQQYTTQRFRHNGTFDSRSPFAAMPSAPGLKCRLARIRRAVTSKDYVVHRPETTGLQGRRPGGGRPQRQRSTRPCLNAK